MRSSPFYVYFMWVGVGIWTVTRPSHVDHKVRFCLLSLKSYWPSVDAQWLRRRIRVWRRVRMHDVRSSGLTWYALNWAKIKVYSWTDARHCFSQISMIDERNIYDISSCLLNVQSMSAYKDLLIGNLKAVQTQHTEIRLYCLIWVWICWMRGCAQRNLQSDPQFKCQILTMIESCYRHSSSSKTLSMPSGNTAFLSS
jgi:hypothetical protein